MADMTPSQDHDPARQMLAMLVKHMISDGRLPTQVICAHQAAQEAIEALEQRIAALESALQDKTPAKRR